MTAPLMPTLPRRLLLIGAALLAGGIAAACANAGVPPGGPPDVAPPIILSVTPKTMTTSAKINDVEIKFDEVISETPKSAADLRQLVFISPRGRDEIVDWHRDRITIHPKGGWRPNTVYSVQIAPGIQDLRNNTLDSAINIVFSTGGIIPATTVVGVAFDWVAGRGAQRALVEAIARDSTIYQVLSDSVGRFEMRHIPMGEYNIRAIVDRNNNRLLDPTEAFDTVRVALTSRVDLELYAFPHDTVGLRISEVVAPPADSLKVIKIVFDKPLAPDQAFARPQFILKKADSTSIDVLLVQTAAERAAADSLVRKAREDSLAAKTRADTSAGARARADSAARKLRADSAAAAERAAREARRLAALRGNRPVPVRDSTPPPKMKKPVVSAELYLTLAEKLAPGTPYRVQASTVRSLSGTVRSPSRQFVTPREVKRDSSTTPTRRPPP